MKDDELHPEALPGFARPVFGMIRARKLELLVPCATCKKMIWRTKNDVEMHKASYCSKDCRLGPEIEKICLGCLKPFKGRGREQRAKRFCTQSCAASFNNKGRIRSLESRRKLSVKMGGKGFASCDWKCKICEIEIEPNSTHCPEHQVRYGRKEGSENKKKKSTPADPPKE